MGRIPVGRIPVGRSPVGRSPGSPRPLAVALAAAILVANGALGFALVPLGLPLLTGRQPAPGPIVGLALGLYGLSIALGIGAWAGRLWFAAANLATGFAIVLGLSWGEPMNLGLAAADAVAAVLLVAGRPWFASIRGSRSPAPTPPPG